jgi:hypothetical protein
MVNLSIIFEKNDLCPLEVKEIFWSNFKCSNKDSILTKHSNWLAKSCHTNKEV